MRTLKRAVATAKVTRRGVNYYATDCLPALVCAVVVTGLHKAVTDEPISTSVFLFLMLTVIFLGVTFYAAGKFNR